MKQKNIKNNSGMALIVVLAFIFSLLTFAGAYMKSNTQNRPINERHFERAQADFIGQGVVELAALKFKKRPAEFYYAYRASIATESNPAPLQEYLADITLNASFTDTLGNQYVYSTDMQLMTSDVYTEDGIRIQVTVEQFSSGVAELTRVQNHIIKAIRTPL